MKKLIKSILFLLYLKIRRWLYIPITKRSREIEKFNKMWMGCNRKQKRKIASIMKSHKFKLKVKEYERMQKNKTS